MIRRCLVLVGLQLTLASAGAWAQAPSGTMPTEFDGLWSVTQECPDSGTAKGYTARYSMVVKNGFAKAQWGIEGQPSSLTVSGQIQADGSATMVANGLTGDPKFAVGSPQASSPVGYTFPAQFTGRQGLGRRTIARPCKFTFEKQ
ncbi:MAG: hypothetical protein BGN99_31620 [Alphaproteobacteria bacterium 65-37]|jgi:hypothetical protein|nr:MAG: hypothetical protein BGN99_31620 [Alphaproteobacteria bacterium 65-37]